MRVIQHIKGISLVMIVALLITCIDVTPIGAMAARSKEGTGNETVKTEAPITLAIPGNMEWARSSTATAKWDAVEGADYYRAELIVSSDGDEILGTRVTGTEDTQIDFQAEMNSVIAETGYTGKAVRLQYTLTAQKHENDEIIAVSEESDQSIRKICRLNNEPLAIPQSVTLSDEGIVSWQLDNLVDATYFSVEICFTGDEPEKFTKFTQINVEKTEGTYRDGVFSCDLSNRIENAAAWLQLTGELQVYVKVFCVLADAYELEEGELSDASETIVINSQSRSFPEIKNISVDENLNVSWDIDNIDGIYGFKYEFTIYQDGQAVTGLFGGADFEYDDIHYRDGTCSLSLKFDVDNTIYSGGNGDGNYVIDKFKIQPYSQEIVDGFYRSEFGKFTDECSLGEYQYSVSSLPIPAPVELVSISKDGILEFITSSIKNMTYLEVCVDYRDINAEDSPVKVPDNTPYRGISMDDIKYQDGKYIADISKLFELNENVTDFNDDLYLRVKIAAGNEWTDGWHHLTYASEYTEYSDYINYPWKLNRIDISPQKPVVAVGNTIMLGKTIHPEYAKYDKIEWTVSDDSIASVDKNGYVTGKKPGKTELTARVGDVTSTVPLNVYEVVTNLDDRQSDSIIKGQAGEIIDNIANNSETDYTNTDIDANKLDDIREEIIEGIENGDTFHTDITYIQNAFDAYKKNWGQIQKAANDLNAQFAGAYNIEVEMYHKDKEEKEYHIGNIIELENEVTFTFDLPTGMKELQSGDTKKYVLVRVHKNAQGEEEYEPIDYTINEDGTFTAKSDKYSDFVWLELESKAGETATPIQTATAEPTVTVCPTESPIATPTVSPIEAPTPTAAVTSAPIPTAPTVTTTSTVPAETTNVTTTASTALRKLKLSSVKCKRNTGEITGKVSVLKATIKVKVGKQAYKKAVVKGKKFTLKIGYKLKKKMKIRIRVDKKGYKRLTKMYSVK